jgi:hypothetical protein
MVASGFWWRLLLLMLLLWIGISRCALLSSPGEDRKSHDNAQFQRSHLVRHIGSNESFIHSNQINPLVFLTSGSSDPQYTQEDERSFREETHGCF